MAATAGSGAGRGIVRRLAQQCRQRLLGAASDWAVVLPALATAAAATTTTTTTMTTGSTITTTTTTSSSGLLRQQWPSWELPPSSRREHEDEDEDEDGSVALPALLGLEGLGAAMPAPAAPDSSVEETQGGGGGGGGVLGGLWDGLLRMAVPKKKVSHRRQRRKLVRYDGENLVHAYPCPACGKPKLRHRLCDDYELCAQQAPAKYRRGGPGAGAGAGASGAGQQEGGGGGEGGQQQEEGRA